jgi:hypothetical protein
VINRKGFLVVLTMVVFVPPVVQGLVKHVALLHTAKDAPGSTAHKVWTGVLASIA